MNNLLKTAALITLLVGCTEMDRPASEAGSSAAESSFVPINYPMSALPLTDRARIGLTLFLSNMNSSAAQRACSPQEREYMEIDLLIYAINYEEWRTKPWSRKQIKEARVLEQRWQALGGDDRAVSNTCTAFVAQQSEGFKKWAL